MNKIALFAASAVLLLSGCFGPKGLDRVIDTKNPTEFFARAIEEATPEERAVALPSSVWMMMGIQIGSADVLKHIEGKTLRQVLLERAQGELANAEKNHELALKKGLTVAELENFELDGELSDKTEKAFLNDFSRTFSGEVQNKSKTTVVSLGVTFLITINDEKEPAFTAKSNINFPDGLSPGKTAPFNATIQSSGWDQLVVKNAKSFEVRYIVDSLTNDRSEAIYGGGSGAAFGSKDTEKELARAKNSVAVLTKKSSGAP